MPIAVANPARITPLSSTTTRHGCWAFAWSARLLLLAAAAVLTAAAVAVVGVIGFVGLAAPHLARGLVGSRHTRVLPVSILLGELLVSFSDTLGRKVISPAQIPAGLVCALIGTPYFIWLPWRTRVRG